MKYLTLLLAMIGAMLICVSPLYAGEEPSLLEVEVPESAIDLGSDDFSLFDIYAFGSYSIDDESIGYGIRLAKPLLEGVEARMDFDMSNGFDFDEDAGYVDFAVTIDLIKGNRLYPYLISGVSTSLDELDFQALAGGGLKVEVGNWNVFVEYRNVGSLESDNGTILAGVGRDFDYFAELIPGISGLFQRDSDAGN